jgi:hypothetical protein
MHIPAHLPSAPRSNVKERFPAFQEVSFRLNGQTFNATATRVKDKDFRELGISPLFFKPGLRIYMLDNDNYARFCSVTGQANGFYPLAKVGAIDKVLSGQNKHLPDSSRIIVLPKGIDNKTAKAHEIAHDIFISGVLSERVQQEFTKTLFYSAIKRSYSPDSPEYGFFTRVAKACPEAFDLNSTVRHYVPGMRLDRAAKVLIGEVFAYAAEIYLGFTRETKDYKLPLEIRMFFDKYVPLKAN